MVSADMFERVWSHDCCPKRASRTDQVAQPMLHNMHNLISQRASNVTERMLAKQGTEISTEAVHCL
jgi:hypothetical protein